MNKRDQEDNEIDESEFKKIEEEVSKLDEKELNDARNKAKPYEENGIEYIDFPLDKKQLREKYVLLKKMEIDDAYNKLALSEMMDQVEKNLPRRLLKDSIDNFEKDIAEGMITKNNNGVEKREKATDAEIDMMKIKVKHLKEELTQDLPMKNLRNQISQFMINMEKEDAPGKNIKKLRKEIRSKKETGLSSRYQQQNKPRSYVG